MDKIKIAQVGAGGTGSWFGRSLMHALVQKMKEGATPDERRVIWGIQDPDVIEARNLIRQPFYGGVGENKAQYLSRFINNFFEYSRVNGKAEGSEAMLRESEDLTNTMSSILHDGEGIIVSCVDNSYSRKVLEDHLMTRGREGIYYVNMGVSEEGHWLVEAVRGDSVMKTPFGELTYPDGMLSCAQRAEATPIPQTVYSNIQAGNMAAHMVAEILYSDEFPVVKRVYGKDYTCGLMEDTSYFRERIGGESEDTSNNTE